MSLSKNSSVQGIHAQKTNGFCKRKITALQIQRAPSLPYPSCRGNGKSYIHFCLYCLEMVKQFDVFGLAGFFKNFLCTITSPCIQSKKKHQHYTSVLTCVRHGSCSSRISRGNSQLQESNKVPCQNMSIEVSRLKRHAQINHTVQTTQESRGQAYRKEIKGERIITTSVYAPS